MKYLFLMITLLAGCANENIKPRTIENYYQSSGIEKYFLSEIPPWANFSASAGCLRKNQIRYFDINSLMKSYSIDYATAIQIQASFNDEYIRLSKNIDALIPFPEEQLLFFRASDKVTSKILFFEAPSFKRINLIWVDGVDDSAINKFLNSKVQDLGVPVLISLCLTKVELESKFVDHNYKMITAEMFSIFDLTGNKIPSFSLFIDQFFKANQEIILYTHTKIQEMKELKGNYKISNY